MDFDIGYTKYRWLVDTGASLSVMKYETFEQLGIPIKSDRLPINGIGGQVHAEGYVYVSLSLNGRELYKHKFYVIKGLPCIADGILGLDFLRKFNCHLNFEMNTISLDDPRGPCGQITVPLNLGKQNYLRVPPRCEKIFYVETSIDEECVVLPKELCKGVFMAGSISVPKDGKILIKILNTREDEVCLNHFTPEVDSLCDYEISSFNKNNIDGTRVRSMFSMLKLDHLNQEEKTSIQNICAKFSDIFYLPGDKLSTSYLDPQKIILKDNITPVYKKPYRLPYSQREEMQSQIDKMLSDDIIETSVSEWSSPVLLVPKKSDENNKKWRLVIDFRKLNECIVDDKFPLPNITDILDALSGAVYFSHLDLHQGYYNLSLHPESRKCTAFTTPSGHYQMKRLPMGLKTSPSCFSRAMTVAMSGLNYEKCLVYQDDLICFGRNLRIHNQNLISIMVRLREVNFKLNPNKCEFLKKEILYLGHIVSSEGIKPDPAKIEALQKYPAPQNLDETRRFVAFSNYYRKFIPNFAEKALPLNNLFRKNVPFIWNDACQNAFVSIKNALMTPPLLHYPNFDKDEKFILQTDASGYALGSILCNSDRRPIAYASRSLNKAEQNYPTIEKELLAIVWSVKYFRPYLYGRKFKIETDHKPLMYLFNMANPSSRLLKFRLILEDYNFEIEYVKGVDNVAADALSRIKITSEELKEMSENVIAVLTRAQKRKMEQNNESPTITIPTHDFTNHPRVVEMLRLPVNYTELIELDDSKLKELRQYISYENEYFAYLPNKSIVCLKPTFRSHCTRAVFVRELSLFCNKMKIDCLHVIVNESNKLFIKELAQNIRECKEWSGPRLCIIKGKQKITDSDMKRIILNDFHLLPSSGHAGIRRMCNNIRRQYFWTSLEKDVSDFVKKCDQCQRQKYHKPIKEPLVITDTAGSAFERVFLDLVGPLDKDSCNFSYILTLQCDLTKYIEAYPLTSKHAESVAAAFVNNFILRYGIPNMVITDRGTEFINNMFDQVCKLLKISHLKSTAYHHQTIGALENNHKHLISYLRTQTNNEPQNWSSWLPYWSFAYNTTVHSETKFSPYELVFGKHCNIPSNLQNTLEPMYNFSDYFCELKYRLQKSQLEARDKLLDSKQKRKLYYDTYVNPIMYNPGDLIMLKNESRCNKLDPLYVGPFSVIKDEEPNVIINFKGNQKEIHKNLTKLYNS